MDRQKVQSSTIAAIGYNPETHMLQVEFVSGGVYQFEKVAEKRYRAFMQASSKGKYFAQKIKFGYDGYKITELKPQTRPTGAALTFGKNDTITVASPCYIALLNVKADIERQGHGRNLLYLLWFRTGKEQEQPKTKYHRALKLIAEAGNGSVGPEHLDKAIKLARERKI